MKNFTIISFYSILIFIVNYYLVDIEDLVLRQFLAQESLDIPENIILDTIDHLKYWNKFSAFFTILLFLLKGLVVSCILYVGLFFEDLHKELGMGDLFKIAVYSESILVIASLIKTIVISSGDFSYDFFAKYYPLSLLNLFDYDKVDNLLVYPLQVANAFELGYMFLLVYFLKEEVEIPFSKSLKTVVSSYGVALVCWVVFILFLTLNLN